MSKKLTRITIDAAVYLLLVIDLCKIITAALGR
jgi:hypothetical protein